MDPMEKYLVIKDKISLAAKIIGMNAFEAEYKVNFPPCMTWLVAFLANLASINTVFDALPDYVVILEALSTFGMAIQVY